MINDSNIGGMAGAPVHGPDDRKIGTVGQVFVDPDTGMPNWITVHTGLFGRRESFVPLDGATWDNEVIRVAIDKDTIKEAPRIDAGEPLTPENEADLYRYYTTQTADAAAGNGESGAAAGVAAEGAPAPVRSRLRHYERTDSDAGAPTSAPSATEPSTTAHPDAGTAGAARDTAVETAPSAPADPDQPRGRHVKLD